MAALSMVEDMVEKSHFGKNIRELFRALRESSHPGLKHEELRRMLKLSRDNYARHCLGVRAARGGVPRDVIENASEGIKTLGMAIAPEQLGGEDLRGVFDEYRRRRGQVRESAGDYRVNMAGLAQEVGRLRQENGNISHKRMQQLSQELFGDDSPFSFTDAWAHGVEHGRYDSIRADKLIGLAVVLGSPPERLMRAAGLLPNFTALRGRRLVLVVRPEKVAEMGGERAAEEAIREALRERFPGLL